MSPAQRSVKPSIMTPANIVTIARVVCVPIWLAIAEAFPPTDGTKFSWGAFLTFLLFVALSFTDKLDGYLARSRNEVTTFGKFLDPIADKLEVVVALAFLLERGLCSSWVLLVVVAREFLVSGLRMVVAAQGTVIAASNLGKAKTATTMIAIGGYLFLAALPANGFTNALHTVVFIIMIAAVVLTAWSGIDYFIKAWPAVSKMD